MVKRLIRGRMLGLAVEANNVVLLDHRTENVSELLILGFLV